MKEIPKTKWSSSLNKVEGFSIPELIVVLLVIAILCVIAIPQINASLQLNRINTLNAAIASRLAEARMQAIKRNTLVSVKVDSQSRKIWLEAAGKQIGGSDVFPAENQITLSPSSGSTVETVTFNSFGNLQTAPPTITVSNAQLKLNKTLQVSLSGKITVGQMIKNQ